MAAFSEEIVEIKCDPHKILNNTYLYRFFCSKFKSFHNAGALQYNLASRQNWVKGISVYITNLGSILIFMT